MRSLDGLNTHDDAYKLSISGGVTTANILPGSADAIGISLSSEDEQLGFTTFNRWSSVHHQTSSNVGAFLIFDVT